MTEKFFIIALLSFLLMPQTPAHALKISPFKATLALGADAPSQVFRVENNSAESAAVQVSVLTWDITPEGQEINSDAENEFIVFPAQLVLQPHESRAIRIQWLGQEKPAIEKAYRLVAEQLPVQLQDTSGPGSAVRFLLRFKAALYLSAGAVQSDIAVKTVAETKDHKLLVTIANKGTGHTLLRNAKLSLSLTDGRTIALTGDSLKSLDGENIHAGHERVFDVPLPPDAIGKVAAATINFDPAF